MSYEQSKENIKPSNGWAWDDQPVQVNKRCGPVPPADPELDYLLKKDQINNGTTASTAADKNTPTSLKQLRWAIYDAVDSYSGAIVMGPLKMQIEELFKEYTHS